MFRSAIAWKRMLEQGVIYPLTPFIFRWLHTGISPFTSQPPPMRNGYRDPPLGSLGARISAVSIARLHLDCSCGGIIQNINGRLLTEVILLLPILIGMPLADAFSFFWTHLLDTGALSRQLIEKKLQLERSHLVTLAILVWWSTRLSVRMVCGPVWKRANGIGWWKTGSRIRTNLLWLGLNPKWSVDQEGGLCPDSLDMFCCQVIKQMRTDKRLSVCYQLKKFSLLKWG